MANANEAEKPTSAAVPIEVAGLALTAVLRYGVLCAQLAEGSKNLKFRATMNAESSAMLQLGQLLGEALPGAAFANAFAAALPAEGR